MAEDPCVPKGPYVGKDLEDILDPLDYGFTADDARGPVAAEPLLTIDDMKSYWKANEMDAPDTGGGLAVLGRFLRVPMSMLKDAQAQTGIPVADWYRMVEWGRRTAEKFQAEPSYTILPRIFKGFSKSENQSVQLILEARGTQHYDEVIKGQHPKLVAAAEQLEKLYFSYFSKAGFGVDEVVTLLTDVVPGIRRKDGLYRGYSANRVGIPKIASFLEPQFTNGDIMINDRELDAFKIARQLFRGVATEKYVRPNWNLVATQFKALEKEMPGTLKNVFQRYMFETLHYPDAMRVGFGSMMTQTKMKLEQSRWFKKVGDRLPANFENMDFVGTLTGLNYQANLGWNPGSIIRQYMQTLQTTAPIIGLGDSYKGIAQGIKWYSDEAVQKYYETRGVVTRDIEHERFREVNKTMGQWDPKGYTGKAKELFDTLRTKGTAHFKTADDFNRIVAYEGMTQHATKHAEAYVKGKISWEQFLQKSKLDMLDVPDGGTIKTVKAALDAGEVDKGVGVMALEFTDITQFKYSRGNAPYFMQSTMGRFLGQYGTWPMWFTSFMRDLAMRGSIQNRVTALGRWAAINSAVFYGAASVFGVDMSRWSFFAPLAYGGGPFMEMGMQATSATTDALTPGGSADVVDQIQASRFNQNIITQTTPLPWITMNQSFQAIEAARKGEWSQAIRRALGFPGLKEDK
jgi:hypothetical protein